MVTYLPLGKVYIEVGILGARAVEGRKVRVATLVARVSSRGIDKTLVFCA